MAFYLSLLGSATESNLAATGTLLRPQQLFDLNQQQI